MKRRLPTEEPNILSVISAMRQASLDEFRCSICHSPPKHPAQLCWRDKRTHSLHSCGHWFCLACIAQLVRDATRCCVCQVPFSQIWFSKDRLTSVEELVDLDDTIALVNIDEYSSGGFGHQFYLKKARYLKESVCTFLNRLRMVEYFEQHENNPVEEVQLLIQVFEHVLERHKKTILFLGADPTEYGF